MPTTENAAELRIQPPSLPASHLPRPRLYGMLTHGLAGRRLTTIVAPSGHGKTTLVAGWLADLRASALPWATAWLSLDADTAAPRPFLHAVSDAIRRPYPGAVPNFKAAVNALPAAPLPQLGETLRQGLARLPGRLLLILDNFEFIEHPELSEVVRSLAIEQSVPLHLVVISQDSLQQFAAPAARRGQCSRLAEQDLLFTEAEAAGFLRDWPGPETSRLQQVSGGRAVGLALGRALPFDGDERARFLRNRASLPWRTAFENMLEAIAAALPDETRCAWLAVALVGMADAELVAQMTGDPEPLIAAALDSLAVRGLLDRPLGPERGVFAIHPLIGRVLLQGETPEFGPQAVRHMRRRAAGRLFDRGEIGPAVRQLAAAGDTEVLAAAVESVLPEMERHERWADVRDLLQQLPPALVETNLVLLMAHIWSVYFTTRNADVSSLVERADVLLESTSLPIEQAAMLRAELEILRGLPSAIAERLARRQQINDIITTLSQQRSRARAEALFGLYMSNRYTQENRELAARIEQELGEDGGPELSPMLRSNLYSVLTGIYARHGPVDKLEAAGRAMLDVADEARAPAFIAWARVALGLSAFLRDDAAQAMIQLEETLYSPAQLSAALTHFAISYVLPVYGQLGMQGRIAPAIEQAARIRASSMWLDRDWPAIEALGLLHAGDMEGAVVWAGETEHPAPQMPLERRALVLAEIRLAEGVPEGLAAALDYLDTYLELIRAGHFPRNQTHALALRARLLWALGRREDALETLEEAISMGYGLGFDRFFVEGGPPMSEMLVLLAAREQHAAEAKSLLARWRPVQPADEDKDQPEKTGGGLLSRREAEILRALALGRTNKEIGVALGISALTVRNHSARLFAKLGVNTRLEAVRRGHALGLLPDGIRSPAGPAVPAELTPAELRVLIMLADDHRYAAIAETLRISLNTVNTHVLSIYRKLGVNRRLAAVEIAREAGIINS